MKKITTQQIQEMTDAELKATFESCCEEYRRRLNEQLGFDIKDSWWIPTERIGEVLALCDCEYSLNIENVRILVEAGVSYDEFIEWWEYNLDAINNEQHNINAWTWFVRGFRPNKTHNENTQSSGRADNKTE